MVWVQYTATRSQSQRAATAGLFLTGAALVAAAARRQALGPRDLQIRVPR
jgi:hypothetical protein